MEWAYGITTVPRRFGDLLPKTIASLKSAGFDNPRLFIDGMQNSNRAEQQFGLQATVRFPEIKTVGNWILALWELAIRQPHADRYAIFQDDFVTCKNLRVFLEETNYPPYGYQNLYTNPKNHQVANTSYGWTLSNQRGLGALALVFDQTAVCELLKSKVLVEKPKDREHGTRSIDGAVMIAMKSAGFSEYVWPQSLVQHTGLVSTMGNERLHANSFAPSFVGEDFNALDLL